MTSLISQLAAMPNLRVAPKARRAPLLFVGSYTHEVPFVKGGTNPKLGEGVCCFAVKTEGEALTLTRIELQGAPPPSAFGENPTYIAAGPMGAGIVVANEEYAAAAGGGVRAFAIERGEAEDNVALTAVGEPGDTGGVACCHVSVLSDKSTIFAANYMSGSVCAFAIDPTTGGIGERTRHIQHPPVAAEEGEVGSRVLDRQEGPHAHMALVLRGYDAADVDVVAVPDLGADAVLLYPVVPVTNDDDATSSSTAAAAAWTLAATPSQSLPLPLGSGPRHVAESPNRRWLFVACEPSSTVVVFPRTDKRTGDGEEGGASAPLYRGAATYDVDAAHAPVSTLPAGVATGDGFSTTAAIRVHPSGDFVYVSNRGHDSIAVLAVDEATGALTLLTTVSTQGAAPRDFALHTPSPTSPTFLLAANQDSDNIVGFVIAAADGGVPRPIDGCVVPCNTPVSLCVVR